MKTRTYLPLNAKQFKHTVHAAVCSEKQALIINSIMADIALNAWLYIF